MEMEEENEEETREVEEEALREFLEPKKKQKRKTKTKKIRKNGEEKEGPKTRSRKKRKNEEKEELSDKKGNEAEPSEQNNEEGVVNSEEGEEKESKKRKRSKVQKRIVKPLALNENGTIDLTKATMSDIIRHANNIGKPMKSSMDKQEEDGREETELVNITKESATKQPPRPVAIPAPEEKQYAPRVRIVDGKMVLDEESLTIRAAEGPGVENYDVVMESGSHVTSSSYTNRAPCEKWGKAETELFYKALSQYGTDFTFIEKVFPNRTRRQIKNKFKKEERENPQKVDAALMRRLPIDVEEYRQLSGMDSQAAARSQAEERAQLVKAVKEFTGEEEETDLLLTPKVKKNETKKTKTTKRTKEEEKEGGKEEDGGKEEKEEDEKEEGKEKGEFFGKEVVVEEGMVFGDREVVVEDEPLYMNSTRYSDEEEEVPLGAYEDDYDDD